MNFLLRCSRMNWRIKRWNASSIYPGSFRGSDDFSQGPSTSSLRTAASSLSKGQSGWWNEWVAHLKLPLNKLIRSSVNPVKLAQKPASFGLRAYGLVQSTARAMKISVPWWQCKWDQLIKKVGRDKRFRWFACAHDPAWSWGLPHGWNWWVVLRFFRGSLLVQFYISICPVTV